MVLWVWRPSLSFPSPVFHRKPGSLCHSPPADLNHHHGSQPRGRQTASPRRSPGWETARPGQRPGPVSQSHTQALGGNTHHERFSVYTMTMNQLTWPRSAYRIGASKAFPTAHAKTRVYQYVWDGTSSLRTKVHHKRGKDTVKKKASHQQARRRTRQTAHRDQPPQANNVEHQVHRRRCSRARHRHRTSPNTNNTADDGADCGADLQLHRHRSA